MNGGQVPETLGIRLIDINKIRAMKATLKKGIGNNLSRGSKIVFRHSKECFWT